MLSTWAYFWTTNQRDLCDNSEPFTVLGSTPSPAKNNLVFTWKKSQCLERQIVSEPFSLPSSLTVPPPQTYGSNFSNTSSRIHLSICRLQMLSLLLPAYAHKTIWSLLSPLVALLLYNYLAVGPLTACSAYLSTMATSPVASVTYPPSLNILISCETATSSCGTGSRWLTVSA